MTIPNSGQFTSEQVQLEWGFTAPFTSSQVSAAAGLNTPWTSEQLRGKSSGPTMSVTPVSNESAGSNRRRDFFTATINWTGGVTPTSYTWAWGGSSATLSGQGTRTCRFTGQSYNPLSLNGTDNSSPICTVVMGGQTYTVTGQSASLITDGNN